MLGLRRELRLRTKMQAPMMRAKRRMAPRMEPTTMPAMAPPDSPLLVSARGAVAFAVAVGKRLPMLVVKGSFTPLQRVSTCEYKQQDSVEFGELAAQ